VGEEKVGAGGGIRAMSHTVRPGRRGSAAACSRPLKTRPRQGWAGAEEDEGVQARGGVRSAEARTRRGRACAGDVGSRGRSTPVSSWVGGAIRRGRAVRPGQGGGSPHPSRQGLGAVGVVLLQLPGEPHLPRFLLLRGPLLDGAVRVHRAGKSSFRSQVRGRAAGTGVTPGVRGKVRS